MQSIGERLEEARKRKGISIREAAEATKIRGDYLHKFESNQYDIKLPEIYVRGFLRTYANFLKLPPDKVISDYNALGLSEAGKNGRSINREIYGRMDISVGAGKGEKDTQEAANATPATPGEAPAGELPSRNPVILNTRPGITIDPNQLLKIGLLLVGVVIAVLLILWILPNRDGGSPKTQASNPPAQTPTETWVRPQTGERALTLLANSPVSVTVISLPSNTVLYQGTVQPGAGRAIPRRGTLRITTEAPQNLLFEIEGKSWPMKDPKTGQFITNAEIQS